MKRPELLETKLREFLSHYESKDLESISRMLAADVLLRDWNLEVRGKEQLLQEFTKNFSAVSSITIDVLKVYTSDSGVCAEILIEVNGEEFLRVVDALNFNSDLEIISVVSYKGL